MTNFWGKYRGAVVTIDDPNRLGRLQVRVPEVLGDGAAWAMPCVPYAGKGVGLIALPPIGSHVWVEFEAGDPEFPIWTGCFWGPGELPATLPPGSSALRVGDVTLVAADPGPGGVTVPAAAPGQAVTELSLTSTGSSWTGTGRPVVTVDEQQVQIVLGPMAITLQAEKGAVTVTQGEAGVTVRADAVELSVAPSTVRVDHGRAAVASGAATVAVEPTTVELSVAAARVFLSGASVDVNNGALEVS